MKVIEYEEMDKACGWVVDWIETHKVQISPMATLDLTWHLLEIITKEVPDEQ